MNDTADKNRRPTRRSTAPRQRRGAGAAAPSPAPIRGEKPKKKTQAPKASDIPSLVRRFRVPLVIVGVVAVLMVTLYGPSCDLYRAWREQQILAAQLDELNQSNEEVQSDNDALMTEEGIKDKARELGYVEEGEVGVVVQGMPEGDSAEEAQAPETPWYLGIGDFIFQYKG